MKRSPAFWERHLQTSRFLCTCALSLLLIVWIWKISAGEGYYPPGFLTCLTLISLLELLFATKAKKASEKEKP